MVVAIVPEGRVFEALCYRVELGSLRLELLNGLVVSRRLGRPTCAVLASRPSVREISADRASI
jgi:hypothetical protein